MSVEMKNFMLNSNFWKNVDKKKTKGFIKFTKVMNGKDVFFFFVEK